MYVTVGVTTDRMIATYRAVPGVMLMTTRTVSHLIDHLRDLQAQALDGVTWR